MSAPPRSFADLPGTREHVPLLVGLMGPSGSGKTFSALRLATGIQRVARGEIFVIDTEARRARHYGDEFNFRHIDFGAPFGSLDYLAAMQHAVKAGAGVIVIDSMSHEHGGPGGYLMTQEAEVDRMAGDAKPDDFAKRERVKFAAWIKPAALRKRMIEGILQLNANFIFCFRAKEKMKPVPGKPPVEMGFMPIAGDEMLFEMTVNCLLLPHANGVPTWRSDNIGERLMMKLPGQFAPIFSEGRALDEDTGQALAEWAKGGPTVTDRLGEATSAAADGSGSFRDFWRTLSTSDKAALKPRLEQLKAIAAEADAAFQQSGGYSPDQGAEERSLSSSSAPES